MKQLKFKDLIYNKEYCLQSNALPHPNEIYIANLFYLYGDTATLQVRLKNKVPGSFGPSKPYNVGIFKNDIDSNNPCFKIFEVNK